MILTKVIKQLAALGRKHTEGFFIPLNLLLRCGWYARNPCLAVGERRLRQFAIGLATRAAITFILVALVLSLVPSPTLANPAFTARTETYVNLESIASPYDITVTKPTGTVDGDILFCWIATYTAGITIDSVPSGWALVSDGVTTASYTANNDKYYLYYKIAASEGANWVWSLSASCYVRAVCSCYTSGDFNAADPIDVVSSTAYRVDNVSVIAASMTVSAANSPLVFWAARVSGSAVTYTKPTLPTTDWVENDDAGSDVSLFWTEVCSMTWSGSGATGAMTATLSNGGGLKHAFAVALNPPAPPATAPTVVTNNETDVDYTWGNICANITDIGTANVTTRGFDWDTDSGEPYASSWNETGNWGAACEFCYNITGLGCNETYYFRGFAISADGTGYGDEESFTTGSCMPEAPTDFTIVQSGLSSINISWTMGTYADTIYIRGSTDRIPTVITDGFLLYDGNGTSVEVTGLDLAINTYYIAAWSNNARGYSTDTATGSIGGESMVFLGVLGICGVVSFLAFRSTFFLFKLMAGAAWVGFWAYFKSYPPGPIVEGSPTHTILLIVIAFVGMAIVIAGLGRGIKRTQDQTGAFSVQSEGFHFHLPDWLRSPESVQSERRTEAKDDYRSRIHRALNPGEGNTRRR